MNKSKTIHPVPWHFLWNNETAYLESISSMFYYLSKRGWTVSVWCNKWLPNNEMVYIDNFCAIKPVMVT
jgi:hypothetical protein